MSWRKKENVYMPVNTDTSGFFFERENLHDISQETSGFINTNDGTVTPSETYTVTPFISVLSNTIYISSFAKTIATYDVNKVFRGMISTTSADTTNFNAPRQFTIPQDITFIRYTRGSANSNPMFVKGETLPHEYLAPNIKQLWIPKSSFVDSLKLRLNPLYDLKWHCLGDSVTNASYPDTQTGTVIGYHQVIASKYGVKVTNYGIGGTRITATGDNQGFVQRYTAMTNDADIITVFGGINDYANAAGTPIGTFGSTDTSTIYGAMDALCSGLLQKYPTKRLGFILPFGFNEYKGANTWKPYEDAMIQVLEYYGVPYLNLRKESLLNANIGFINTAYFKDGDKTHPNSKGHAILARKIYAFLTTL
jgi:lysophospholipase L1-like esterase